MRDKGHTQKDVERLTGVPQPQVSRALNGLRKRPTKAIRKLCDYAFIGGDHAASPTFAELSALLQEIVAGHPAAAECVKGVLQSLAPLVTNPTEKSRQ
jgi:transcriptional regulator with XRE-family HTH domain